MQHTVKEITLMMEAGYVLRYAKRYAEAREIFRAARALRPEEVAPCLGLAGVAVEESKFDEAQAYCRHALQVNSSSAAAHAQLAEIHLLQGRFLLAQESIQSCLGLTPKGPAADWARSLARLLVLLDSRKTAVARHSA